MSSKPAPKQPVAARLSKPAPVPAPAAAAPPTPGTPGRKPVDPNETASQRFVRLGKHRLARALKDIEAIERLSGPGYDYTPEQAAKVVSSLAGAVTRVRDSLAKVKAAQKSYEVDL